MFGLLGNIGPWELILVLTIALIIFGPGKLPEVGKSIGRSVAEFKKASTDIQKEVKEAAGLDELNNLTGKL